MALFSKCGECVLQTQTSCREPYGPSSDSRERTCHREGLDEGTALKRYVDSIVQVPVLPDGNRDGRRG